MSARAQSAGAFVLAGGTVVDVVGGRLIAADVVVEGDRIAAVVPRAAHPASSAAHPASAVILDVSGRYVAPGLVDGHLHIESSLMTPLSFAGVARRTAWRGAYYRGAAVAGAAAVGAAAAYGAYAYPPPAYYRPPCGYYPYPPCY